MSGCGQVEARDAHTVARLGRNAGLVLVVLGKVRVLEDEAVEGRRLARKARRQDVDRELRPDHRLAQAHGPAQRDAQGLAVRVLAHDGGVVRKPGAQEIDIDLGRRAEAQDEDAIFDLGRRARLLAELEHQPREALARVDVNGNGHRARRPRADAERQSGEERDEGGARALPHRRDQPFCSGAFCPGSWSCLARPTVRRLALSGIHLRKNGGEFRFLHAPRDRQENVHVELFENARGILGLHVLVDLDEALHLPLVGILARGKERLDVGLDRLELRNALAHALLRSREQLVLEVELALALVELGAPRARILQDLDLGAGELQALAPSACRIRSRRGRWGACGLGWGRGRGCRRAFAAAGRRLGRGQPRALGALGARSQELALP